MQENALTSITKQCPVPINQKVAKLFIFFYFLHNITFKCINGITRVVVIVIIVIIFKIIKIIKIIIAVHLISPGSTLRVLTIQLKATNVPPNVKSLNMVSKKAKTRYNEAIPFKHKFISCTYKGGYNLV